MSQSSYRSYTKENEKRKKEKKKKESTPKKDSNLSVKIIAIAILIYFGFTLYQQHIQLDDLKKDYEEINYEYSQKEKELIKLNNQLKSVDSKEFVEKQARENLKMVKPNETVYVDTNKNENLKEELDVKK